MSGSVHPQMNVNRGNTNTNGNNATGAVGRNGSATKNAFCNSLNTKPNNTKPKNKGWFRTITITLAVILQILLGLYCYAPIYYSVVGEEWVMWLGAVGSSISAVIGVVLYGLDWSGANKYPYNYKWYDYFLSQLTGLGFAVGWGIALALLALIITVVCYILAAVFVIAIFFAFLAGLGSC